MFHFFLFVVVMEKQYNQFKFVKWYEIKIISGKNNHFSCQINRTIWWKDKKDIIPVHLLQHENIFGIFQRYIVVIVS